MRAIWYTQQGPASEVLTLGEVETPVPGPGEVAVWMHASGVNPSDVKIRSGTRGPMTLDRQIPHSDGAGVIKQVGQGVHPGRIGERVWLYNAAFQREGGTCAELCVLPAEQAIALPDRLSFEEGAAIGIPAITAHRSLFCSGPIKGKSVLITGGAGSVGLAAIQLAKWGEAGQVITTVSGPEKASEAMAAGADEIINYTQQDVAERVLDLTQGRGADHVVEVEFGGNLDANIDLIRPHGTIAAYGSEGYRTPVLPFYDLMMKNVTIQMIFMYQLTQGQLSAAVEDISAALDVGALRPLVWKSYPLEETALAHEAVEADGKVGAVVVEV